MHLNQVRNVLQAEVPRDGEFTSLGLLSHRDGRMLVAFYDPGYLNQLLANPHIACVVTRPDLVGSLPDHVGVVVSPDPVATFYRLHDFLMTQTDFYGPEFPSVIASGAAIHERATIAPRNVRIGRGTLVEPGATVLERSYLGDDCIIRAGAVIGGEGFEPKHVTGRHVVIGHAGGVRLGDRVEIQANSHVARSVFGGCTEIGSDTKLDALVHVGHNVQIGCRCEIAAGAIIGGSTTIGDDVWIGPNATLSSEVRVGDRAFICVGSVVIRDVPAGQRVLGNPARAISSPGRGGRDTSRPAAEEER